MLSRYIAVLACGTFLGLNSYADSWDKKTVLTVDAPILSTGDDIAAG